MVVIRLLAVALVLSLTSSSFGQSCNCEASPSREAAADALLFLTNQEKATAERLHAPWGLPTVPVNADNEYLLHQHEWITSYDTDLKVPLWACYQLRSSDVVSRHRDDCFRRDPRLVSSDAAFCDDYEESVFDRGHLVPRADMNRSDQAMLNTFVFSNMTPQFADFNQGVWERLESHVRDWAKEKGEVYVLTGAVFDKDEDGERDDDEDADRVQPTERVAIPTHFYKIVLRERPNGYVESIAILLPHDQQIPRNARARVKDDWLRQHLTSIDNIEEVTEMDFFRDLPDHRENAVERAVASDLW